MSAAVCESNGESIRMRGELYALHKLREDGATSNLFEGLL